MKIRAEEPRDCAVVRQINSMSFDTAAEARLVDVLREQARPVISLVAEDEAGVLGHIMFSPVTLPGFPDLVIMGLAPMAVVPRRQREGIGSALVRAGLEACRKTGAGAVVVLGHRQYYPRFGFVPSTRFGIGCEYDVPPDIFMALELEPGYLTGASGIVQYHPAFAAL